jgi:hypothetical protein
MARDNLGHWSPGTSGNAGGRPKPPDGLRTRLAELSPGAAGRQRPRAAGVGWPASER